MCSMIFNIYIAHPFHRFFYSPHLQSCKNLKNWHLFDRVYIGFWYFDCQTVVLRSDGPRLTWKDERLPVLVDQRSLRSNQEEGDRSPFVTDLLWFFLWAQHHHHHHQALSEASFFASWTPLRRFTIIPPPTAEQRTMKRPMGSLVVAWTWVSGSVLLGGTRTTVGAICLLPSMSIKTTTGGLSISGCYRETVYLGLYQTTVWTIEGQDIADTGTAAIVADLVSAGVLCMFAVFLQYCRKPCLLLLCHGAASRVHLPWHLTLGTPRIYYIVIALHGFAAFLLIITEYEYIASICGTTNPSSTSLTSINK